MSAAPRFRRESAALLIIDVQEHLAAAMPPEALAQVLRRSVAAVEGARALGLPIVVTEQYPKGLGPTVAALQERIEGFAPIEKLKFSAWLPQVRAQLAGRPQVLVLGMEAHVCVFQTVRDLTEAGLTAFLARDAVLSRTREDLEVGVGLCRDAGAIITSVEAALFDALVEAGGPAFKAVSAAVK